MAPPSPLTALAAPLLVERREELADLRDAPDGDDERDQGEAAKATTNAASQKSAQLIRARALRSWAETGHEQRPDHEARHRERPAQVPRGGDVELQLRAPGR